MFSGLVTAIGRVRRRDERDGGVVLAVEHPYGSLEAGESIAVNGACLTVEAQGEHWFRVHAVPATLERTTIADWTAGRRVNLERALRMGDRLGGHLVQGHVDAVGQVQAVDRRPDTTLVTIRMPDQVARVTVPLGSITVDGVSLTVNGLSARNLLQVSLVPFTLEHTTLGALDAGDAVHLEADAIGKYVEALLAAHPGTPA